jgi:putative transposase
MAGHRFGVGIHILFQGREYTIDARLRNRQFRLKDVATGEFGAESELRLIEALFDNQMEFIGYGGTQSHAEGRSAKMVVDDLAILRDENPKEKKRKEEARRRIRYVNEVQVKGVGKLTKKSLDPVIAEVAKRINDPAPPCWSTLYNWIRAFKQAGEDVRVLIPVWNKRGGKQARCSGIQLAEITDRSRQKAQKVDEIIQEVINERFLSPQRLSVAATYKLLDGRIRDVNRMRLEEDRLPIPHLNTLYKRIGKLDGYDVDLARYGRKYADNKHMQVGKHPRPTRPLERVEADHTITDLIAVDMEKRLPIGRATLTDVIDSYSKMIVGSYLGFEPPSYLTVMQCLLNAIKPKTYVKKLYPEVENDWECYGIPETLVVDNGKEFHSQDFVDACEQMGTIIEYAPPGNPQYKASKERYFGSLNTQLLHTVPGTTFSNILKKGDYNPHKNAIVDVKELCTIHHLFMVDIYPRQYHKGIRDVPARLWNEGVKEYPPRLPRKGTDIRIMLGKVIYREVRREGIEFFGLYYNDERLAEIRGRSKGGKVKVKFDPEKIAEIYVADSDKGTYIAVPSVDPEYTEGLTLYQHDVIRNYARGIAEEYVDKDALWRARKNVQEIVEKAWERSKKTGTRTTLERFRHDSQKHSGHIDDDQKNPASGDENEFTGKVLNMNSGAAAAQSGVSDLPSDLPGRAMKPPEEEKRVKGLIEDDDSSPPGRPKRSRKAAEGNNNSRGSNAEENLEELESNDFDSDFDEDDPNNDGWGGDCDGDMNNEE